jgi:spermidine synthase
MSVSVDRKSDGSLALYIDGDLQFDSKDECIYHETLVQPALALALGRIGSGLKALIIGGGDGLVARELFRKQAVSKVDLVDYDPKMISLGQSDLSEINKRSLHDKRLSVHIEDAWEFVQDAQKRADTYDLIICDLTVAEEVEGARFHSIDWYLSLNKLLSKQGVMSVNAVSPQATPLAFWSVFNGIQAAGFESRPCHVTIPSFSGLGYGSDWGFLLAAHEEIHLQELEQAAIDYGHNHFLKNPEMLKTLFEFPAGILNLQNLATPFKAGSDLLLHYFQRGNDGFSLQGDNISSFSIETQNLVIPPTDDCGKILPHDLRLALNSILDPGLATNNSDVAEAQQILSSVLEVVPYTQKEHSHELISDFIAHPAAFLQAIDLAALVARLLQRASELPAKLVEELNELKLSLQTWSGDHLDLLSLGNRVITVLTLVVVVGNLLYPDMVYAKGAHTAAASRGARSGGIRGYGYGGYNNTYWTTRRPVRPVVNQNIVSPPRNSSLAPGASNKNVRPSNSRGAAPDQVINYNNLSPSQSGHHSDLFPGGYSNNYSANSSSKLDTQLAIQTNDQEEYTDISGVLYPIRSYKLTKAVLRLSKDVDLLPDGKLALPLNEQLFLLLDKGSISFVDSLSGDSLLSLFKDEQFLQSLTHDIEEQRASLLKADQTTAVPNRSQLAESLDLVLSNIVSAKYSEQSGSRLPFSGSSVLPSVWLTDDGQYLVLRKTDGQFVYLNDIGWYANRGFMPLAEEYPTRFRKSISAFLVKKVRAYGASKNSFRQMLNDEQAHSAVLEKERDEYRKLASANNHETINQKVAWGSRLIASAEALDLSNQLIRKISANIAAIQFQIDTLPSEVSVLEKAINCLNGGAQTPIV